MNRFEEPPFLHFKTRNVVTKMMINSLFTVFLHGSRPPKINTLSLLFFQRFLLVSKYGTKRVRPEREQWSLTMRKQIWKLYSKQLLSRQPCLTSIIRDPVDVNALPALFRLKHWSDLLIRAIVRNIWMGSQKRSKSNEAQLKLHSFVIIIDAFWLADWVMTSGLHYNLYYLIFYYFMTM